MLSLLPRSLWLPFCLLLCDCLPLFGLLFICILLALFLRHNFQLLCSSWHTVLTVFVPLRRSSRPPQLLRLLRVPSCAASPSSLSFALCPYPFFFCWLVPFTVFLSPSLCHRQLATDALSAATTAEAVFPFLHRRFRFASNARTPAAASFQSSRTHQRYYAIKKGILNDRLTNNRVPFRPGGPEY